MHRKTQCIKLIAYRKVPICIFFSTFYILIIFSTIPNKLGVFSAARSILNLINLQPSVSVVVNLGAIWQSINTVSTHERTIHKRKRPTAQKKHQTHLLQWCSLLLVAGTNDTRVASVDGFDKKAHEDKDCEDTSTSVKTTYREKRLERFPLDWLHVCVSGRLLFQVVLFELCFSSCWAAGEAHPLSRFAIQTCPHDSSTWISERHLLEQLEQTSSNNNNCL